MQLYIKEELKYYTTNEIVEHTFLLGLGVAADIIIIGVGYGIYKLIGLCIEIGGDTRRKIKRIKEDRKR